MCGVHRAWGSFSSGRPSPGTGSYSYTSWFAASWQPEVVALAIPLRLPGDDGHALNVSVSSTQPMAEVAAELGAPLIRLGRETEHAMAVR